jgi:hypothetical protein
MLNGQWLELSERLPASRDPGLGVSFVRGPAISEAGARDQPGLSNAQRRSDWLHAHQRYMTLIVRVERTQDANAVIFVQFRVKRSRYQFS